MPKPTFNLYPKFIIEQTYQLKKWKNEQKFLQMLIKQRSRLVIWYVCQKSQVGVSEMIGKLINKNNKRRS